MSPTFLHPSAWRRATVLATALVLAACGGGGGADAPAPATHTVSVRIDSTLASGESFTFSLGTQTLNLTTGGTAATFAQAVAEGSAYTVSQTAGPRTCTLSANRTGTMATANVLVAADCGVAPTPQRVSVTVTSPVGAGESFGFSLGSQAVTVTQSNVASSFAQTLLTGASYTVNQTAGPRTCTLSSNRTGTIAAADVAIQAACGTAVGVSSLTATLRAAVGTQVTVQLNGASDLAATVVRGAGNTDVYDETPFTFTPPLPDGTAYQVSIAAKPANQTCAVYKGATGTLPVANTAVRVGCDFTYDHVSRNTSGSVLATRTESFVPSIGGAEGAVGATTQGYGEGRFVAFVSSATGLSPNGQRQVFWRDRLTGETKLVSATSAGAAGNGGSDRPVISADGLVVIFESDATNLVAGDTNGSTDIFGWLATDPGNLERLSVGPGGVQANASSHWATVSGDGRVVAFSTNASNLTGGVAGTSTTNVVRRDVLAATNVLVTANGAGTGVGGDVPALSEDGNRLAFWSFAADLVAGDTNGLWDIFVYQHDTGSRRRVSLRADGGERNQGADSTSRVVWPAISGNGRFVAFATTSTNVVTGDTNATQDIFVVDLDGSLGVRRVSVAASGAQGNGDSPAGQGERVALSFDGNWAAFTSTSSNFGTTVGSGANVFLRNLTTGELRVLTDASFGAEIPTMSRSAAYVAFGAGAQLDSRYASTGLFAHFTAISRAWWWID